jgi:aminopeptidase N
VSHQWFGLSVTERWNDIWLSEGIATYLTHMGIEHYQGGDAMVARLRYDLGQIVKAVKESPEGRIVHADVTDLTELLNPFVYQKAGWVMHMLRHEVGDDAFWLGLREYCTIFRGAAPTTDDFRQVMERAAGKSLNAFFSQWFMSSGIPRIGGSWQYDPVAKQVIVTLSQTQQGASFQVPVEIGILQAGDLRPRIERVELLNWTATYRLPAAAKPTQVLIDPNSWLLMESEPFVETK